MHHIYTTPAFIVHSTPYGEAGKFFLLFTRDFGMIGAVAQGVRLSKSKLKYHLQDADFSLVSLVRGKEVWRITGAGEFQKRKKKMIHLRILKLLKRLLHGEERNEDLYNMIEELYKADIREEDLEFVETLSVLRILNNLGYISGKSGLNELLESVQITDELVAKTRENKSKIIPVINSALIESQL